MSRRVTVERGAVLNHDLIYVDEKPVVRDGANVYGDVRHADAGDFSLPFGAFLIHAAIWLAVHALVAGARARSGGIAPGAADAAFTTPATGRARRSPGASAVPRPAGPGDRGGPDAGRNPVRAPGAALAAATVRPGYAASAYALGRRHRLRSAGGSPPSSPAGGSCGGRLHPGARRARLGRATVFGLGCYGRALALPRRAGHAVGCPPGRIAAA